MKTKKNISKSDMVYNYTYSKLKYLESLLETGFGKGIMANLRRGIGKNLSEVPELWGLVFDEIPEELSGKRNLSDAEWAIYTALTLYALHQQGNNRNMNCEKISIGKATEKLVKSDEDMARIVNRLKLVVTATSSNDIEYHLRSIIQLLKNESIPLDYPKLAKELYLFRNSDYSESIKLSWGRDFYSERSKKSNNGGNNDEQ